MRRIQHNKKLLFVKVSESLIDVVMQMNIFNILKIKEFYSLLHKKNFKVQQMQIMLIKNKQHKKLKKLLFVNNKKKLLIGQEFKKQLKVVRLLVMRFRKLLLLIETVRKQLLLLMISLITFIKQMKMAIVVIIMTWLL